MNQKIADLLMARTKYLSIIEKDLDENEKQRQTEEKKIGKYEDTIEYLETVVERPRWNSLLKVSEKVYIPGFITHTGEYMVEMPAHPNSYKVLYTAEQTMAYLNKKLKEYRKTVDLLETQKNQLTERANILTGKQEAALSDGLPSEIVSDRGVALRVGDFYEILEIEDK